MALLYRLVYRRKEHIVCKTACLSWPFLDLIEESSSANFTLLWNLFFTIRYFVCRIFRWIGCPYGCGDGVRGSVGDHLRAQGLACLGRLNNNHSMWFAKFLRQTFIRQPLQDIVDFLHALQGFCVDPSANVISPQTPGENISSKPRH